MGGLGILSGRRRGQLAKLAGRRSHQPTTDGTPAGGLAWWDVVAPSAGEAIELALKAVENIGPGLVDRESVAVNSTVGHTV